MDEKIDINQADVDTLASLPGIGPARAEKIVAFRKQVHPFEEIIELTAVSGISERMVQNIAELITVNGTAEEQADVAVEEIVLAVEEIEIEPAASDNGGDQNAALETAEGVEEEAEELLELDESEETAEPELIAETAEPEPADQEEPSVVVTMLDDRQAQPEPEAAPEPPPRPEVIERRVVETVQRRHLHFWQQFAGVILGAVIGSGLTLMLLFFFNGTLRFAGEKQVSNLQIQLDEETSNIRQSQSSMADDMGQVTGRLAELDNGLAASEGAIQTVADDVTGLEEETAALNEKLETINLSAEKFDNFLSGLRDLLFAVQGPPPSPTSTTTISGTATITTTVTPEGTAESPSITPTPTAAATEGPEPTRTPRPTATPLIE